MQCWQHLAVVHRTKTNLFIMVEYDWTDSVQQQIHSTSTLRIYIGNVRNLCKQPVLVVKNLSPSRPFPTRISFIFRYITKTSKIYFL
jgi:hypothetical protein